ncbi:MAG: hypothetical protein OEQ74_03845 [Gammaproteobacteria bacterium]|nr:hypothetical protein [Gammaproteobacteria bacterium]
MRTSISLGYLIVFTIGLGGCATAPTLDASELTVDTLERRQLQTRRFDGISENQILAASAGVLQDLGFNLDESETKLGIIVASKQRTAREPTQIATSILLRLFLGIDTEVDDRQRIRVALVSRPAGETDTESFQVRVTFQRVVWKTNGDVSRTEAIDEPELYQQFFEQLSKSVFLEAQQI